MSRFSALPPAQGLYDPQNEHDACGVAFVATLSGIPSNEIVEHGLTALRNLDHRGAVGGEPDTGDGAGILIQVPDRFLREVARDEAGAELPAAGSYAAGMAFLPIDPAEAAEARERSAAKPDGPDPAPGMTETLLRRYSTLAGLALLTVAAIALLPSPRARGWAKVKLAKHLFEHRYDYRAEWLRFTDTLGRAGEEAPPLGERTLKAFADILEAPGGMLIAPDLHGSLVTTAMWNWTGATPPRSSSRPSPGESVVEQRACRDPVTP